MPQGLRSDLHDTPTKTKGLEEKPDSLMMERAGWALRH